MYMLIPELSSDVDEPLKVKPEKEKTLNINTRRTEIRFIQDERRWRICGIQSEPEAVYLFVKPYRCPHTSKKFCVRLVTIPNRTFVAISDCHQAVTYRDVSGKSHTIILTWKKPNRLSHCHVEEIFAT